MVVDVRNPYPYHVHRFDVLNPYSYHVHANVPVPETIACKMRDIFFWKGAGSRARARVSPKKP